MMVFYVSLHVSLRLHLLCFFYFLNVCICTLNIIFLVEIFVRHGCISDQRGKRSNGTFIETVESSWKFALCTGFIKGQIRDSVSLYPYESSLSLFNHKKNYFFFPFLWVFSFFLVFLILEKKKIPSVLQ